VRPAVTETITPVSSSRLRGRSYVALSALAWSSAGVVQRNLTVDPMTQVVGRSTFACLAIFAFVAFAERAGTQRAFRSMRRVELGFAVCTAISSAAFILALNATTVANVLVLQAAAPLLAAALGQVFLGEQVTAPVWLATLVALTGMVIMVGGPGGGLSAGLLLAGVVAVSFATSIVLARRRRDVSMAPASCLGQLLLVVCLAPLSHPAQVGAHDLLLLGGLGIGQIGLGFVLLTLGARLIPAAEIALLSLLEVALGPLWVWLARGEIPAPATLAGGCVILSAVLLVMMWTPRPAAASG
jgi:drug/metabolite transporter (DMT)-like permease